MSGKVTVRNGDNATDAGTALPWTGTKAVCLGFESITLNCLATQDTVLVLYTGITDSTMTAAKTVTVAANVPASIVHTVDNSHFYVAVSGGAGTIEVETLLHYASSAPRYISIADSTSATVPTATSLTHTIDLGASVSTQPITVGLCVDSTDATASAFERQASPDGTTWYTIDKFTATLAQTFHTFDSNGCRFLQILYSNGTGVNQDVAIHSSYWQYKKRLV